MATINKDGTFDFSPTSSGLHSIESITREALRMFVKSHEKVMKIEKDFEDQRRLGELRKSCGVEPEMMRIKIKLPERYHG
jgi:hypothetical protein